MSPIYTPGKVLLRNTWQPMDPDAAAYITAVETADGQALEEKVKIAIDNFVLGCKADGIWNAIKASCILAGARTRLGALTPLVGTAPTSFNFVDADYNRKTGLIGNGSTKYLNSNRAGDADPQNNFSLTIMLNTIGTQPGAANAYAGNGGTGSGSSSLFRSFSFPNLLEHVARCRASTASGAVGSNPPPTGLFGVSRNASGSYSLRTGQTIYTSTVTSQTPASENYLIFCRNNGSNSPELYTNARLAFYSIGESLDLAKLDARVTDLINAFAAAIP